jgi:hypothetical protein
VELGGDAVQLDGAHRVDAVRYEVTPAAPDAVGQSLEEDRRVDVRAPALFSGCPGRGSVVSDKG